MVAEPRIPRPRRVLPREEDTVVKKTAFGAFTSSTIDETLRSLDVDTLVVVGIATNCCVSTTVRYVADLGYGVVLVEGVHGRLRRHHPRCAAIRGLHFNFARVVATVDEVAQALDEGNEVYGAPLDQAVSLSRS